MFELPEFITLAMQMNETLIGKTIRKGKLGNTPHKFVWYNQSHEEFKRLTQGKYVAEARAQGGRYDEVDLFNQYGGYQRIMDSKSAGCPCPECGSKIERIQYLGGMCCYCPSCQV